MAETERETVADLVAVFDAELPTLRVLVDIGVVEGESCGAHSKIRLDEQPLSKMIADLTPFELEAPLYPASWL